MNVAGIIIFSAIMAAIFLVLVLTLRWSYRRKRRYRLLANGERSDLERFLFAEREPNWYVSGSFVVGFAIAALLFVWVCAGLGFL